MKKLTLLVFAVILFSCSPKHEQNLDFKGFTVENGIYKPKPDWKFVAQNDGTFIVAKEDNSDSGGTIDPCDCALTTGGSCDQATSSDEFGNIIDIWCVSSGCGFCVGGVTEEPGVLDTSSFKIKFRLENNQRVSKK